MALKLLAVREHSRLELVHKLRARGLADEAVEAALDRLAADGALDEERMLAAYVAERAGKGFGPLRIRAELRERGLPDDRIETHLGSMADEWPERLADAHDRRFGSGGPSDSADYGRRGRFLEQRGFPTEMIRRFLR